MRFAGILARMLLFFFVLNVFFNFAVNLSPLIWLLLMFGFFALVSNRPRRERQQESREIDDVYRQRDVPRSPTYAEHRDVVQHPVERSRRPVVGEPPDTDDEDAASFYAGRAEARAGLPSFSRSLRLLDIGVIGFRTNKRPTIYRGRPLDHDVTAVQPFVRIWVSKPFVNNLQFLLLDDDDIVLFSNETKQTLDAGTHLLSPAARMPLNADAMFSPRIRLVIKSGATTIAEHHVFLEVDAASLVRTYLSDDGEITGGLTALIQDSLGNKVSLDDLLGSEGDDDTPTRRQR